MVSQININGLSMSVDGDTLIINGNEIDLSPYRKKGNSKGNKEAKITKDQVIGSDFEGNIRITGDNVKIVIQGDVDGNITGAADIEVGGDVDGNITGCNQLYLDGDIDGNVVGCTINRKQPKGNQK